VKEPVDRTISVSRKSQRPGAAAGGRFQPRSECARQSDCHGQTEYRARSAARSPSDAARVRCCCWWIPNLGPQRSATGRHRSQEQTTRRGCIRRGNGQPYREPITDLSLDGRKLGQEVEVSRAPSRTRAQRINRYSAWSFKYLSWLHHTSVLNQVKKPNRFELWRLPWPSMRKTGK